MTGADKSGDDSSANGDGAETGRRARPCPICSKMSVPNYFPFCSKHCADVDLNRWLKESYAIPAVEPPDGADAEAEAGPPGADQDR